MTSKERLLGAIHRKPLDRLPASPDFCYLFPMRLSGLSTWDIWGPHPSVPIWKVRIEAFRKFDLDGWIVAELGRRSAVEVEEKIEARDDERISVRYTYHTRKGDLSEVITYPKYDAAWITEFLIKDLDRDLPRWMEVLDYDPAATIDRSKITETVEGVGEDGVVFAWCDPPLNRWFELRSYEAGLYDIIDKADALKEVWSRHQELMLAQIKVCAEAGVDLIFTGGSFTSISIISPAWFERYVVPDVSEIVRVSHECGVPCEMMIDGKCNEVLELIAATGADVIENLEKPPLGNVNLADAKRRIGDRLCLKGNVDPVNTMLRGTPEDVEREVREVIETAGAGGGLIVSTCDQIPRDTPYENIVAFRDAVEKYGREFTASAE